jgi:pimeloyl-ACP methyl ester carboxylesterase
MPGLSPQMAATQSGTLGALGPANPVPALIVAGGLDPYATPAYAQSAASEFKDAKLAVFPSLSAFAFLRGPACVRDLRLSFLRDPHASLDIDGCVRSAPPFTYGS